MSNNKNEQGDVEMPFTLELDKILKALPNLDAWASYFEINS